MGEVSSDREKVHQYLVARAKASLADNDPAMAKSWLLTCSIMFPRSFELHHDRYRIAKSERDVVEAAACLSQMLAHAGDDDNTKQALMHEQGILVDVVRAERQPQGSKKEDSDGEKRFLRQVFFSLSLEEQQAIVSAVAESSSSESDVCWLLLLSLQLFPSGGREPAEVCGRRLLQHLDRLRLQDEPLFLHLLVTEALPAILLSADSGLRLPPHEMRARLTDVLAYLVRNSILSRTDVEEEKEEALIEKVSQVVGAGASQAGECRESDGPMDLSVCRQRQQPAFASLLSFLVSLRGWARAHDHSLVLAACPDSQSSTSSSRPRIPSAASEIVARNPQQERTRHALLQCVQMLDSLDRELVHKIGLHESAVFRRLRKDASLVRDRDLNLDAELHQEEGVREQVSLLVQRISAGLSLHENALVIRHCVSVAQLLDKLPEGSEEEQTEELEGRLQFLQLDQAHVLSFLLQSLIQSLRSSVLLSLAPAESWVGALLVLSQWRWPRHAPLAHSLLSAVLPQLHSFSFPAFARFVRVPDLVEGVLALAERSSYNLNLGLEGQSSTTPASERTHATRGLHRGKRDELRSGLARLMATHAAIPTDALFKDFILNVLANDVR